MNLTFEWDEHKNLQNRRKHDLSFEQVRPLFAIGHDYLEIFDTEHSQEEDRFICIGPIETGIVVVVITEAAIRRFTGLTLEEFALASGVGADTVRAWEAGSCRPEGSAMNLLRIAARHPGVFTENVRSAMS